MQTISFDEFLRPLKQDLDRSRSMLLGVGASVESGVPFNPVKVEKGT